MINILTFFVLLVLGAIPSLAVTANQTVSVNLNIVEVCTLELNYSADNSSFAVQDQDLRGLQPGNPLSYKTVHPVDPAGINVAVYSNGRNGTRLQIGADNHFASTIPGNSKIIPVEQLKWTSLRGNRTSVNFSTVPTMCFSTSRAGIVTDNIKYELDLYSLNSFGEYDGVITFTAINN